jgi:hypothetical protein
MSTITHSEAEARLRKMVRGQIDEVFGKIVHRAVDGRTWTVEGVEGLLLPAIDRLLGPASRQEGDGLR